jgi:hypothetical protein
VLTLYALYNGGPDPQLAFVHKISVPSFSLVVPERHLSQVNRAAVPVPEKFNLFMKGRRQAKTLGKAVSGAAIDDAEPAIRIDEVTVGEHSVDHFLNCPVSAYRHNEAGSIPNRFSGGACCVERPACDVHGIRVTEYVVELSEYSREFRSGLASP